MSVEPLTSLSLPVHVEIPNWWLQATSYKLLISIMHFLCVPQIVDIHRRYCVAHIITSCVSLQSQEQ